MPFYETEISVLVPAPDGKTRPVKGPQGLQQFGPVIQVVLAAPKAHAEALQKAGKAVPDPIQGFALIDTGAQVTAADEDTCRRLGLAQTGVMPMSHADGVTQRPMFPLRFHFPNFINRPFENPRMPSVRLDPNKYILLLGRDLLARFRMTYNGVKGRIELCL